MCNLLGFTNNDGGLKEMAVWDFLNISKSLERQKVICLNCESPISLKITRDWTSEICQCGCQLYYPPHQSRAYGVRKFIPRAIYLRNKEKEFEREKFINDMKKKGIDVKDAVLQTSKTHRCLTHETKIESGEYTEETDALIKKTKEEIEKKEFKKVASR